MTESIKLGFADHTLAIILMLLGAFLLGLLLGYLLWYTYRKMVAGLEHEKKLTHKKLVEMEKDQASLKYNYDELKKDYSGLKVSLNNCEADKVILQNKLDAAVKSKGGDEMVAAATAISEKSKAAKGGQFDGLFKPENLQIIEGVGPKMETFLHESGIKSWNELAGKTPEDLRMLLDQAESNYKIIDPSTWPKQAELAATGNWDELIQYQKFLGTGKETSGDFENDSKFEKLALKKMGFKGKLNDLKIVEGIGPKIEELLNNAGINTWTELSNTAVEKIQQILDSAGDRYRIHNPSSWPKQAKLAAEGKWDELEKYQDLLEGGRE